MYLKIKKKMNKILQNYTIFNSIQNTTQGIKISSLLRDMFKFYVASV